MAGAYGPRILARRNVWRPVPGPQFCDWCQLKYDGPECPECGKPAAEDQVGQVVVEFSTADGRRWVVWAIRGADGRWHAERVLPADTAAGLLADAS
jgi:hypothetical protein